MIFGMSLARFTQFHVALSIIAIGAGFLVVFGMMAAKRWPVLTALFLITTVATSVTGFMFSYHGVTPGIVLGILSMVVLLLAVIALYGGHLAAGWRGTYVVTAILALYLNFFVLIVQSFEKVPALHALAPTGKEMAFKFAQLVALVVFIVLTVVSYRKFHPAAD
jgi:Na+/H+ antiporter NhaC